MNAVNETTPPQRWPLARLLILLLAGGFVGLMADIRVEHVEVVRERSIAWLPIIYAGVMAVACGATFLFWTKVARRIMLPLFLAAFVVGGMGFYFHNDGKIRPVITTSLQVWTNRTMTHSEQPPQLAPLAFAGLGLIGLLASLERFRS